MKSYTSLEQSKKLAEILPPESADMYYKYVLPKSDRIIHTPEIGNPIDSSKWYNEGYTFGGKREPITLSEYCIPCWSLAALLDLLPNNEHIETTISRGSWKIDTVEYLPNTWWCEYEDSKSLTEFNISADNPVDACVAMIEKLHEQNLL